MSKTSFRKTVINILCDTTHFPPNYSCCSYGAIDIIKPLLSQEDMASVKNVNNSIRQALETISGYEYSNGTQCYVSRQVTSEPLMPPVKHNNRCYKVLYTFH